ncbi:MAG: CRISPR-associated endonuclease Cas1, partial [Solirubrobacteraceae bacterium]
MTDDEDLTIGLVAHHVFCPRRAWLEEHGERTDTVQMATGTVDHSAVDDATTSRTTRLRAVDVRSPQLGLRGRCDSIEIDDVDGSVAIVEHKSAPLRRRSEVTDAQAVQLALQARCLREAGQEVSGASVWFTTTRTRVDVALTPELEARAVHEVVETRRILTRDRPPAPLEDDTRCRSCSHVSVCLPDEHRRRVPARRIAVADPLGRVLHLTTPGSRASLRRGRIEISARDAETVTVPLGQVAGLVVHGNVDVSGALLRETLARGYPIVWCSWSGRVVGWATPADGPNGDAHGPQHRLDAEARLVVARAMISGKIRNERHVMRRHALDGRELLLTLATRSEAAGTATELFGIEGLAAATYFREFAGAVRPTWATFAGRGARPATDEVNAALNVAYGLLLTDVIRAVIACGLDPAAGVLHTAGRNKPALALDLMEELRPAVAESAVLWALNNGEIRANHFRRDFDAVRMTAPGRKVLIATYERRVASEFTHPTFGYRVTWRRAMEIQARML